MNVVVCFPIKQRNERTDVKSVGVCKVRQWNQPCSTGPWHPLYYCKSQLSDQVKASSQICFLDQNSVYLAFEEEKSWLHFSKQCYCWF